MAADVESLLHDVLVFMQQLQVDSTLRLAAETRDALRGLVDRLQQAGDHRPAYLAMNGNLGKLAAPGATSTLQRDSLAGHDGLARTAHADADDVNSDTGRWPWRASPASPEDADRDSSPECIECLEDADDDWPPRGAPSCPRPDLSPDWAVSGPAAQKVALRCGAVLRPAALARALALPLTPTSAPRLALRPLARALGRRCWAALLPAPARLLVFAGPRAARPRLVLPLAVQAVDADACCDACCAVYAARQCPQAAAFELCCPGRKTYQLWAASEADSRDWVEALRLAAHGGSDASRQSGSPGSSPGPSPGPAYPSSPSVASAGGSPKGSPRGSQHDSGLDATDPLTGLDSRSRSASVVSDHHAVDASPAPPALVREQQEQYESMQSPCEEIYHDIASPVPERLHYANVPQMAPVAPPMDQSDGPDSSEAQRLADSRGPSGPVADARQDEDQNARPLYDDVGACPRTCPQQPEYCNLHPDLDAFEDHLYDDIGPNNTCASVYELIQEHGVS